MEFQAIIVGLLVPATLSATAYGLQKTLHLFIDSPEEKWRKRYMKSLIRLHRGY